METTSSTRIVPAAGSGFSVVLAERVLREADTLGLCDAWTQLPLGNPSGRRTAYRPEQRIAAVLSGLAAGLKGIAPGNSALRPNSALQARLGGRFPDQGTIHRWLDQVTAPQAAALRDHLHQVVRSHGRFHEVLYAGQYLMLDVDGQGLVARGAHFEQTARGYLDEGLDRGYQRYVCYAADTREVLDEFLTPGNRTLMSELPEVLSGLDAVLPRADRKRVIMRLDAHGGTIANVRAMHARARLPLSVPAAELGGGTLSGARAAERMSSVMPSPASASRPHRWSCSRVPASPSRGRASARALSKARFRPSIRRRSATRSGVSRNGPRPSARQRARSAS